MAIYNGTQKVSVSGIDKVYVGTQLVYQKAAAKVLQSITLSGYNSRLAKGSTYVYGGTVTANYSDGTTADVTSSASYSRYNMSTAGTYQVLVTYDEGGVHTYKYYTLTVYGSNTLFQGTKTYSWKLSNSTPPNHIKIYTDNNMPSGTYRVTFTMSDKLNSGSYFEDDTSTSTKPSSPHTMTINASSTSNSIIGVSHKSIFGVEKKIAMHYTTGNIIVGIDTKCFYLFGTNSSSGSTASGTLYITVTKLEYVVE